MKIGDIVNESVYHGYVGHRLKDYGSVKRGGVDEAIPSAIIEPQIRNTDTYMQMRYGIALAAAAAQADPNWEQESVWAENLAMIGYTEAEINQIQAADKLMGVKGVKVSHKGSQEHTDVNTTSPVADTSWKKSK
jgi:hypothetical protein